MADKTRFNQVLEVLKKEGYSNERIAKLTADLTKAASAKFYTEAIATFSDEDMKAIEACTSQEEANFEIRTRFAEKTGKNPDIMMQEFLDTFAQGFLDQYQKDKNTKA